MDKGFNEFGFKEIDLNLIHNKDNISDIKFSVALDNLIGNEVNWYELQRLNVLKGKNKNKQVFKNRLIQEIKRLIISKFNPEIDWIVMLAELNNSLSIKKWEKRQILINKYIEILKTLNIINSELYNHTEFYETQYMLDYNHELFNVFKNKLGYYTKLANKIKNLSTKP